MPNFGVCLVWDIEHRPHREHIGRGVVTTSWLLRYYNEPRSQGYSKKWWQRIHFTFSQPKVYRLPEPSFRLYVWPTTSYGARADLAPAVRTPVSPHILGGLGVLGGLGGRVQLSKVVSLLLVEASMRVRSSGEARGSMLRPFAGLTHAHAVTKSQRLYYTELYFLLSFTFVQLSCLILIHDSIPQTSIQGSVNHGLMWPRRVNKRHS